MPKSPKTLAPEIMIGVSATVIALASLLLSVWQGLEARHHDRLSVLPRLTFKNAFATGEPHTGITLANKGVGPAIVQKFAIFVDGKPVESDDFAGWLNALSQLGINETWADFHYFGNGDALSAGETVFILVIAPNEQTPANRRRLENATRRLRIVIVYTSVYGQQFTEEYPGKE